MSYNYRMKCRVIYKETNGIPHQMFRLFEYAGNDDDVALKHFQLELTPYYFGPQALNILLVLPMWLKKQSIGGVKWIDVIKSIPKGPWR